MIERLREHLQKVLNHWLSAVEHNWYWKNDSELEYRVAMMTANIAIADTGYVFVRNDNNEIVAIKEGDLE